MWIVYAFGSAFFAGVTAILAKIGIKNVESNLATAIRTIVVSIFAWMMVFVVGSYDTIGNISGYTFAFLILSGLATGASWICYYKALKDGEVAVVVPVDKLSILVTIAFSYFVLKEKISKKSGLGLVLITIGTMLLVFL